MEKNYKNVARKRVNVLNKTKEDDREWKKERIT